MRCIRPIKASLDAQKNITFSLKEAIPGLVPFEIECRKCLACRLNTAAEKAVRAVHEASQHENNMFLTLTYADEHLASPRLVYSDWQAFMKRLRFHVSEKTHNQTKLTCMVTGEYGDKNKRPHWHALIFGYRFPDEKVDRETERGDKCYTSETLSKLWRSGRCEYGDLTIDSANYVCRYAAKKLVHGTDDEHDYHPIHRTSSRNAVGRSWIEKYYEHTFQNGFVVIDKKPRKIPRYYVDWAKKYQPDLWWYYVTKVRPAIMEKAAEKQFKDEQQYWASMWSRKLGDPRPLTRPTVKETILKLKFNRLQEKLKL